ncbi:flagellar basal body L-ring protein FlgH [Roseateles sp. DAIF2]|uniref:flagellar basal body L-ring protein FlgH n=1 Tax=Roseateles sp. DAIF2 TaxID=2714952 RepID=UPI0018A27B46|nr:flagellar basal body L-ring protein FlgH [Roseateles sp. DAIF2]QPF76640.1 flagellar basal body L-ring protein FlgH [Roseateles sp. DAIF2]
MSKAAALLAALALLGGCAAIQPPQPPTHEPAPLAPAGELQSRGQAKPRGGGVYQAGRATSLTADTRAFRPGDVLTVMLAETTQASKSADTQLGKQSSADFSASLRNSATKGALQGQRDFNGSASSSQQNQLQGAITVVVHEVLPNGLLRVQGEKSLWINQGEELIRLGGYVRAADVDSDNRVSSQRIANARISYSGQGDLASANTPGWLTRMFNSPLAPF